MLIVGLGAAGVAVAKILLAAGVTHIVGCDSKAARCTPSAPTTSTARCRRSSAGSPRRPTPSAARGGPADVIEGADLFIGLSGAARDAARGARAHGRRRDGLRDGQPEPRGHARGGGAYARIIATGRSDYPNQINNVLCFPGIFRGALDVRARDITEEMKMAAARGIAEIVADDELREDYIIPSVFNRSVAPPSPTRSPRRPRSRARPPLPGTRSATPPATRRTSASWTSAPSSGHVARTNTRCATSPSAAVVATRASAA